ncbi:MAG: hypothetical protein ABI572_11655 [Actinomycetota bacterium]
MPPETGPRWYETPLWLVPQILAYVALLAGASAVVPIGAVSRTVLAIGLVAIVFIGSVRMRAWLRRRDA